MNTTRNWLIRARAWSCSLPLLCAGTLCLFGQERAAPAPPPSERSIREELDALKQTQQQILQELESIKALLQGPQRSEVAARPAVTNAIHLNVYGEPFKGSSNAPVAIIEYSDFDCSFCGHYAREVFPRLDKDYVQSGKVRYYFRDMPAPGDTNALLKARAARCAGEQGKFWETHDRFFSLQGTPQSTNFQGHLEALGLDSEALNSCLASGRYLENIRRSIMSARQIHVYGTPAFIIGKLSEDGRMLRDGKLLVGGDNYDELKETIDALLAGPSHSSHTP